MATAQLDSVLSTAGSNRRVDRTQCQNDIVAAAGIERPIVRRDPEIANLLSPPPATTVPEPADAIKVKEVCSSDRIVSSALPEPRTTADPGFVTRSVV